jgi:transmembrane sensor
MTNTLSHRVSPQARSEATEWFVLLRERGEPDTATREAFLAWVRRSPDNVQAFLRVLALWEDTGVLKESDLFDRDALLRRALESSNIVELETFASQAETSTAPARVRRTSFRVAIAASVLIAIGTVIGWIQFERNTYVTGTGEQRTVALQDGSTITLNAESRVRVRFRDTQRDIDLIEGQAIFRVAHNVTRPFVVHSGSASVRAVGTQFDVYRKLTGTTVTVLEGIVAVHSADIPSSASEVTDAARGTRKSADIPTNNVLVSAGKQITLFPRSMTAPSEADVETADVETAIAWIQGKLVFNETPLTEVVTEFNRYSSRRLVIDDPELQGFHISGVFPSSDPGRVAELLRQRFGVTVRESQDEIRVVRE